MLTELELSLLFASDIKQRESNIEPLRCCCGISNSIFTEESKVTEEAVEDCDSIMLLFWLRKSKNGETAAQEDVSCAHENVLCIEGGCC